MVYQVPELPGEVLVDEEKVHDNPLIGASADHVILMEETKGECLTCGYHTFRNPASIRSFKGATR